MKYTNKYWSHTMKHINLTEDLGKKQLEDKWKGKFLDDSCYQKVIKIEEDTAVLKPVPSLDGSDNPLGYFITNAYNDNNLLRDTLKSITDVSTMRANASGPIDKEEMKKKGMIEGEHYKLRTQNSYFVKTKSGKWGMIAYGNEIHSIMIGYKRGRFTGTIGVSGWCDDNPDKWENLQTLPYWNEKAYEKANPDMFSLQKNWAKEHIKEEHRIKDSIVTTMSANKYNEKQSRAMSAHIDSGDYPEGLSTMAVFKDGVRMTAYSDYNISGTSLTFTLKPANNSSISIGQINKRYKNNDSDRYQQFVYDDNSTSSYHINSNGDLVRRRNNADTKSIITDDFDTFEASATINSTSWQSAV